MATAGDDAPTSGTAALVGWCLVGVQAALLAGLALMPRDDAWATPRIVELVGTGLFAAGVVVALLAALVLGSALTATPEPRADDRLRTDGLYTHVRHPIYSGVLLIVAGVVVRSGSARILALGACTVGFFHLKARWEERRLEARYPEYGAYRDRTPRFVPRPWHRGRDRGSRSSSRTPSSA